MGCGMSIGPSAISTPVNELKRSRHSRRRMSMECKFIEERHDTRNYNGSSTSTSGRYETASASGMSGRTTVTAVSTEMNNSTNTTRKVRHPMLGNIRQHHTWSQGSRTQIPSDPPSARPKHQLQPPFLWANVVSVDSSSARQTELDASSVDTTPAPVFFLGQQTSQHGEQTVTESRRASASSPADSFVLIHRRVVVACEAPPEFSPIRHQSRRIRRAKVSRTSSCTWPSAAPSGTSSVLGSQMLTGVVLSPSNQLEPVAHTPVTDTNATMSPSSNEVECLMATALRMNSTENEAQNSPIRTRPAIQNGKMAQSPLVAPNSTSNTGLGVLHVPNSHFHSASTNSNNPGSSNNSGKPTSTPFRVALAFHSQTGVLRIIFENPSKFFTLKFITVSLTVLVLSTIQQILFLGSSLSGSISYSHNNFDSLVLNEQGSWPDPEWAFFLVVVLIVFYLLFS